MTTLALVEAEGERPRIVRINGATAREVMRPIVDIWEEHGHRARIRHEITLNVLIVEKDGAPVLGTQWRTLPDIVAAEDVTTLQALWQEALNEVIS